MTALLEAQNVKKIFSSGGLFKKNETIALEDLYLYIQKNPPTITGIAGESGSGKTTLAKLLLGFITPSEGKVLYKGKDLNKMTRNERMEFRREVQAVFQDPFETYNPFYKIDHILTTPLAKYNLASSKTEARKIIENALEVIGLQPGETLGRYPHQLSGGQRQRIMVARAFLIKPRIILADEPVSMVDASLRATILKSLLKLKKEYGISLLYISHDLTTTYQISDNILVLYQGSLVEVGDVEMVIKKPQHPYTQLLISSIPHPDPNRNWGQDSDLLANQFSNNNENEKQACKFVDRCPKAMALCRQKHPPLYQTDPSRAVRCFLYKNAVELSGKDFGKVMSYSKSPLNVYTF
jgi:oligopeptide/dipeptide ABC transporter ATP-binding protein